MLLTIIFCKTCQNKPALSAFTVKCRNHRAGLFIIHVSFHIDPT